MTERDNANLALAAARIYPALADLFNRSGIDEPELLRLFYRMSGEIKDPDEKITIQKRPIITPQPITPPPPPPNE